jgi:hypothetical protein
MWRIFETFLANFFDPYIKSSQKTPSPVRQRTLLSRPTLRRQTPIMTTGLRFSVKLEPV